MIRNIVLLSFVLIQTLYSSDTLTPPPTIEYLKYFIQGNVLDVRQHPFILCPNKCCVRTFLQLAQNHLRETGSSLSLYCKFQNSDELLTFVENMQNLNKSEYTIALYDKNQTLSGTFTQLNS